MGEKYTTCRLLFRSAANMAQPGFFWLSPGKTRSTGKHQETPGKGHKGQNRYKGYKRTQRTGFFSKGSKGSKGSLLCELDRPDPKDLGF